jgi:hypothetical protein
MVMKLIVRTLQCAGWIYVYICITFVFFDSFKYPELPCLYFILKFYGFDVCFVALTIHKGSRCPIKRPAADGDVIVP